MFKDEKKLLGFSSCINCNKRFGIVEIENARTIQKTSNATVMHLTCKKCGSSTVLGLIVGKAVGVIGMPTDLTENDINKIIENKQLTTDEILELSDIINNI